MNEPSKDHEQDLFDNEPVVEPRRNRHNDGAVAFSGIKNFFETKWKRRLVISTVAALSVTGLSIKGNEYISRLRHQSGADFGHVAISTASHDITKQHLTEKFGNQIGQAARQTISGDIDKQAKEFAVTAEKEFIYLLEKDLHQDINGDSYIGPPSDHHKANSFQASPIVPTNSAAS